jgi:signal transduction histidine kinase/CheY-like chemotaxis protein
MRSARLLRLAVLAATAAILLAQALATALLLERSHRAALEQARETLARVGRSVEAAINRNLLQVDSLLLGLPVLLQPVAQGNRLDGAAASLPLRELANQNFAVRDLLLVGADNLPVATALAVSRRRPLPLPLGDAYADTGVPGGVLRIGGPVRNPMTGEWSVFFARPVTLRGVGSLTAVAELPVSALSGLLAAGGEPPGLRVTLERRDGTLLASLPHDEGRIGTRLPRGGSPSHIEVSRFDGQPVLGIERPTLYPAMAVVVTMDRSAALAGWRAELTRAILVSLGLGALVVALAGLLLLSLGQRARVEEERQRWRARLESALDSMNDGFVMFDAEDRLVICNQRYKELYAASAPYIVEGAHFDDIIRGGIRNGQYPQFQGDPERFIRELKAWRRSNGPPIERLLPDGRWVLITERPMPDGGTVGIRTDITALKRAMQEVEEAAEAKTMFLARMSHELRTPLNAILGFAQLLLSSGNLTAAQYEQLRLLHEAGHHLRDLVNSLLDLAKINAGKLELELAPTPLVPLLEGCAGLLGPEAQRKGVELRLERAPGLPEVVEADATRLRQMVLNLLSNAVKFTPGGGLVLLRAAPLAGGTVRIEVQDSGPGVPEAKRHLLFQDFTQLGRAADAESPGTGLGLAITARLAALMKGRVGVDSQEGRGATFWIELPLRPTSLPPAQPAAPDAAPPLPPLRLLVADDIAPNRILMRAMLTAAGHEVTLASDGAEALAQVRTGAFDAVLMDVRMPGMDGLEATRRIRALPGPVSRTVVIAVTASALPEEIAECEAAGMDAHIAKPVDREALFALLRRLCEEKSRGAPSGASPEGPGRALLQEFGASGPVLLREFMAELEAVAAELQGPEAQADAERLRALFHRGLGASATLGAEPLRAAFDEATARLRQGDAAAAVLGPLRERLAAELPTLRETLHIAVEAGTPAA